MDLTADKEQILKKMFYAALKEKLNQLAREYDYSLVFELWAERIRIGEIKAFCEERWKPNITIAEAIDSLDVYCKGLQDLLKTRQKIGDESKRRAIDPVTT